MKLLIVEDEINLAESLKIILESEGLAVTTEYDGASGLKTATKGDFDLILLDINLPHLDGITLCRRLRQGGMDVPVIMLTAREATVDRVLGLDAGADDYLPKPFDTAELLARIRALLRRQTKKVTLLTIDGLTIDSQSQTVKREGQEIELSAKEYALLVFLAQRPGQVVSKQAVMTAVWPEKREPDSNIVDVYIGYVRKKIDKAFPTKPPLLTTIKGRGYRLGAGP